jgi:PRD domain protein (TIGR03582 family)
MSPATGRALDALATSMAVTPADRDDVAVVIAAVEGLLLESGFSLNDDRRLALAAHSLAFTRRIRTRENLPEIDLNDFPEIPEQTVQALRDALSPYCASHGSELTDEEVLLFAMHVEIARLAP